MARKKAVDELFTTHFYPFVQTEIKSIMGLFAVVFCRDFERPWQNSIPRLPITARNTDP